MFYSLFLLTRYTFVWFSENIKFFASYFRRDFQVLPVYRQVPTIYRTQRFVRFNSGQIINHYIRGKVDNTTYSAVYLLLLIDMVDGRYRRQQQAYSTVPSYQQKCYVPGTYCVFSSMIFNTPQATEIGRQSQKSIKSLEATCIFKGATDYSMYRINPTEHWYAACGLCATYGRYYWRLRYCCTVGTYICLLNNVDFI